MIKIIFNIILSIGIVLQLNAVSEINRSLIEAISTNNLKNGQKALSQGASVNSVEEKDRKSALILASENGSLEFVELLLLNKALVNSVDMFGNSALMVAKDPRIVNLLLQHGADIDQENLFGETALDKAEKRKDMESVRLLEKKYCTLERLMNAIFSKNLYLVQNILKRNILNINVEDVESQQTPLIAALSHVDEQILKLLLNYNVDVNQQSSRGIRPLFFAIANFFTEGVKLLLSKHVDINVRDNCGNTALMHAIRLGHREEIIRLLLETDRVDINAQNFQGDTALMYATMMCNASLVKLLIDRGADVNIVNNVGNTVLLQAIHGSTFEIIKLLIDAKANVNQSDTRGYTPLMLAASLHRLNVLEVLLKAGAKINIKNSAKLTALDLAILADASDDIIELLMQKGASSYADPDSGIKKTARSRMI